MPKLTIDGREVEVEAGTKVIDAAERLGIKIPRFCYLKSLGAVGACRMCAVKFLEGHKKGLDMSCMVDVREGMVVSTNHPEAMAFRAQVIEWLMLDHPHDCPICDEGGHCLLQDMTVSGGHGIRHYRGKKRTYENQYLGPLIQHEMNRCIHCYRCVRFYREYAGGTDYGTFGIAGRVYYGRFESGRLESPFSGNIAEICPTGTLTDKPSRYRARRWDLERAPSVCLHCSLGCNTTACVRYREVLRIEARENEAVNDAFLCDRGRYGFGYASQPERPRQALVDGKPVCPEDGAAEAARRIRALMDEHGPDAMAVYASARCSLEDFAALHGLTDALGIAPPAYFSTISEQSACHEAASRLDREIARDLGQVRKADFVLVLGADPLHDAPLSALAIRQAQRAGAKVAVLDPRPVDTLCDATAIPVARHFLPATAAWLLALTFPDGESSFDDEYQDFWRDLQALDDGMNEDIAKLEAVVVSVAQDLAKAKRPVVVCAGETMPAGWITLAAGMVRLLRHAGADAGLCCLLPEANSLGAALADSPDGRSLEDILIAVEGGSVKALVCVGGDPLQEFPRTQWARSCMNKLELLVSMDYLPSDTWNKADVSLPLATMFESGGCYVNSLGMLQRAAPVFLGGTPVKQTGGGSHPPREFTTEIPGSDPQPVSGWTELMRRKMNLTLQKAPSAVETWPTFSLMREARPGHAVDVLPERAEKLFAMLAPLAEYVAEGPEEVIVGRRIFGSDPLANQGVLGRELLPDSEIFLHTESAEAMDLADGDVILLPLVGGLARGVLRTSNRMARNTVVLPRIPDSGWQFVGGVTAPFPLQRIWKEQGETSAEEPSDKILGASCPGDDV